MNSSTNLYFKYKYYRAKYYNQSGSANLTELINTFIDANKSDIISSYVDTNISKLEKLDPSLTIKSSYNIRTLSLRDIIKLNRELKRTDAGATVAYDINKPTIQIEHTIDDKTSTMSFISFSDITEISGLVGPDQVCKKILYINFSFTFEDYRRLGFSIILRSLLEKFAKSNGYSCIGSSILPGANSDGLTKKIGYEEHIVRDGLIETTIRYKVL